MSRFCLCIIVLILFITIASACHQIGGAHNKCGRKKRQVDQNELQRISSDFNDISKRVKRLRNAYGDDSNKDLGSILSDLSEINAGIGHFIEGDDPQADQQTISNIAGRLADINNRVNNLN